MHFRTIWTNVAVMILFAALGLSRFSENVRSVQIIGLFASGAAFGVALATLVHAWRASKKQI